MKRTMVIIVVALIALGIGIFIGHRMGKNNAIKALNGGTAEAEVEEETETAA